MIVLERLDVARIALLLHHPLQRELEGQLLDVAHRIDGQRVVHVEADHGDGVHAQVAVGVDLAAELKLQALVLGRGEQSGHVRIAQDVFRLGGGLR